MTKAFLNDPMSVAMQTQARATLDFTPRDDAPAALVPDPDLARVTPAKAPFLRKLIDRTFNEMFAAEKTKVPGGEILQKGIFEGTRIEVAIDYGSRMHQVRYGVSIPDETKTVYARRLTYEGLFAAGHGWDYLTEENAGRSVDLLRGLIARIVRLRNTVRRLVG